MGSLVYLTITRPDIAHVIHILSQFVGAPTSVHYAHLLRVLRYLRGTATQHNDYFMPSQVHFNCMLTLILHGQVILWTVALSLVIASLLVLLPLHGNQRNKVQYHALVLKQNLELLLLQLLR